MKRAISPGKNCFLPLSWPPEERASYWDSCEIYSYPEYAFGETLAIFRDRPMTRNSLLADMKWLACRIAPNAHDIRVPPISQDKLEIYLRRYRLRDPRRAALAELLAQPPSATVSSQLLE